MKTLLLFGIICFFNFNTFTQVKVNYTVYFSENLLKDGLKVVLNYTTKKAQDSIYLHYANEVWGETDLFNCLEILEAENPSLKFQLVPDSNRIIVHYPKSKLVSLTYRIHQDFIGDSLDLTNRPRMNNSYFHVLGQELFIIPEDVFFTKQQTIEAKITWKNFPKDYKIHNTFASQKEIQIIKADINSEFYHSLFVGGDYRFYQFDYKNKPIVFAVRGTWYADYSDDLKMFEALKKTVVVQREFWKDYGQEYYTVIMTPTVSQNDSLYHGQSTVGSAVKNGFMIQSSNNVFNHFGVLNYIYNHEMMHDWIGLKIRNAHEELNYWFSEGFTDYYTYKNRLRSNDINSAEWIALFNEEVILAHYQNPKKNTPNYKIKDDFWNSREIEKVPYRRGAIFAFWLDNKIMKVSNQTESLDDLMRVLLKTCVTENKYLSDEFFLEEARKFLNGEDISYKFQKYILIGEDLELTSEELIDCFGIELKDNVPQLLWKQSNTNYLIYKK